MKTLKKIVLCLLDFLFPSACALCAQTLIGLDEKRLHLCEKCQNSINFCIEEACIICGKPLVSEIHTCLSCRKREESNTEERPYERIFVLFPYIGIYKKLLTSYKFEKIIALADFFAIKIIELISKNQILKNSVIVPVPPRPGKKKETGWDQVEYLVKRIKKLSNYKILHCLKRKKSRIQKQLNRSERLLNMKGRIYMEYTPLDTALIIDDVITTGSTIEVCSLALKKGGVKTVYALCLFYD